MLRDGASRLVGGLTGGVKRAVSKLAGSQLAGSQVAASKLREAAAAAA